MPVETISYEAEIAQNGQLLRRIPHVHQHMMNEYERKVITILAHKYNQENGIFEFGTWRGLTTHVLHCTSDPTQHIWTLDYIPPKDSSSFNPYQAAEVLPESEIGMECKKDGNITQLLMDSMKFVAEEQGISGIDFCLVDGNHTYEYVKHDAAEGMKMLRVGGVLVLHDYRADIKPNAEQVHKGNMNTDHDGVCQFIIESHLNWKHIEKTNLIYTEKTD